MALFFLNELLLLWRQEKREQFPTWISIFTFALSSFFELSIYWFTSKALGNNLEYFGNYFQFVVLGQLVVFLPIHLLSCFSFGIKQARQYGTLDAYLLLPMVLEKKIVFCALGSILRNLFHWIVFFAQATLVFGLSLSLEQWVWLFLLQVIFLPLFLAAGLTAAGVFLYFGRGVGVFHIFAQALAIVSGVYFPLSIFPLLQGIGIASPFQLILELSRSTPFSIQPLQIGIWAAWSFFFLSLSPFILRFGLRAMQARGKLEFSQQI